MPNARNADAFHLKSAAGSLELHERRACSICPPSVSGSSPGWLVLYDAPGVN